MSKVAVLGSGGWGLALSMMAYKCGHDVTVWSLFPEEIAALEREREHKKLLPGVKLPEGIVFTSRLEDIAGAQLVVLAVPSTAVRNAAKLAGPFISRGAVVINVAKGLEAGTNKRLSEVVAEELGPVRLVQLSGPSHAEEVARGLPTACVAASTDRDAAELVQDSFMNPMFRLYTSSDLLGVELGGALKNVIALAAGISDGMGYGDNTKAALMTRGITEIARLGTKLGGLRETFGGLSGIGDLIVTCTSMHSRNRRAGILIGQGLSPEKAVEQVGTVEGYRTAPAAYELGKSAGVEMPIINEVYSVLFEGKDCRSTMIDLMTRRKTHETELLWL